MLVVETNISLHDEVQVLETEAKEPAQVYWSTEFRAPIERAFPVDERSFRSTGMGGECPIVRDNLEPTISAHCFHRVDVPCVLLIRIQAARCNSTMGKCFRPSR